MNKLYLTGIVLILSLLIGGVVWAADAFLPGDKVKLYDKTPTLTTSDYIKSDYKYGIITINDTKAGKLSEYTITNKSESLIEINMIGKVTLYRDSTLFQDIKFINLTGITNLSNYKIQVTSLVNDDIQVIDNIKSVCNNIININTSKKESVCENITSYKTINKTETNWIDYDGQIIKAGNYDWKINGNRNIGEIIDIVPINHGLNFSEWLWYNTTWNYKQEITQLSGNKIYLNITKNEHMSPDFSDLRFTNSTENEELYYFIRGYDAYSARVEVITKNESSIYMYYGNTSTVTTTSSISNVYGANLWRALFMDDGNTTSVKDFTYTTNATGTNTVVRDGIIGNSMYYNGLSSRIAIGAALSNPETVAMWIRLNGTFNYKYILGSDNGGYDFEILGYPTTTNLTVAAGANRIHPFVMTIGTWYHIVVVNNVSGTWLYVNGVLNSVTAGAATAAGSNWVLGANHLANGNWFNGTMDEVVIYNRALDSNQIKNLFILAPSATYGAEQSNSPTNTCTYSGSGDWNILCSDNCSITSTQQLAGNLNISNSTGPGYVNVSALINFTATGKNIYVYPKCQINIYAGGRLGK